MNYHFERVFDNGVPVRGLWARAGKRGTSFYSQKYCPEKRQSNWARLYTPTGDPCRDKESAIKAMMAMRSSHPVSPVQASKESLSGLAKAYLEQAAQSKSPGTITKERYALERFAETVGDQPVNQLTVDQIEDYASARRDSGASARTVNLDVLALSNALEWGHRRGLVDKPVTAQWTPHKTKRPPIRQLLTPAQIDAVCQAAKGPGAPAFVQFIKYLSLSGCRLTEATQLCWTDIQGDILTIQRNTKFDKARTLNMSTDLQALLAELPRTSEWIFPDCRNVKALRDILIDARTTAGVPVFTFHLLRHYFISTAVSRGVDFLTIARWVGHADGGVLIGKVYGHLSAEHAKRMAERMSAPATINPQDQIARLEERIARLSAILERAPEPSATQS